MKKVKYLLCLVLLTLIMPIMRVGATATDSVNARNAVLEYEKAFYRKGEKVQYDSWRVMRYATPEDATTHQTVFTVCSAYTYQVYYNTLGIDMPHNTINLAQYAKDSYKSTANKNKDYILEYYDTHAQIYGNNVLGKVDTYMANLVNKLKVGDIFVIRRKSKTGHAMIVKSIDKTNKKITMLESGGGKYDYDNQLDKYDSKYNSSTKITEGSIKQFDLKDRLKLLYSKSGKTSEVTELTWIRVIHDNNTWINKDGKLATYTLKDTAKDRLKFKDLDINKYGSTPTNSILKLGQELTVTITVKNSSASAYTNNIVVKENIDSNMTVTDKGGGTLSGGVLTFTIPKLASNTSKTIKYKVKVNSSSSLIGKTLTLSGTIGKLNAANLKYKVGYGLSTADKETLKTKFKSLGKTSELTEMKFINEVYKSIGYNLSYLVGKNASTMVKKDGYKSVLADDVKVKKVALLKYYGKRISAGSTTSTIAASYAWVHFSTNYFSDRARTVNYSNLNTGDIIFVYTESSGKLTNKVYMYIGDKTLLRKYAKGYYTEYNASGSKSSNGTTGNTTSLDILRNMMGDNYIIIRPGLTVPAKSVSLDKTSASVYEGSTVTLKATVSPSTTTYKDVTWTSSNTSVATVSNGVVKGIKTGTATITAKTENGKTAKATITVTKKPVDATSIKLNSTTLKIKVGNTATLTATILPTSTTNKTITWTSSNTSVATVSNGVVKAIKTGTATITAKTSNGKTATCTVTVSTSNVSVTSISLDKTSANVYLENDTVLTPTILPSNATNKSVTWTSSDTSVATVSNGIVTGKKIGTTTITAKTSNGKIATATVKVIEVPASSVTVTPNKKSIYSGDTVTLYAEVLPINTTNKSVTWTSSNTNIATVKAGVVTALKPGTVTISAKASNGKIGTATITVVKTASDPVPVPNVPNTPNDDDPGNDTPSKPSTPSKPATSNKTSNSNNSNVSNSNSNVVENEEVLEEPAYKTDEIIESAEDNKEKKDNKFYDLGLPMLISVSLVGILILLNVTKKR